MSRPNLHGLVVRTPELDSPVPIVETCGESFAQNVRVRVPYRDMSAYEAQLPPIMSAMPVEGAALSQIEAAIELAQATIDGRNPDVPAQLILGGTTHEQGDLLVVVDRPNYDAIRHLLDRARYFLGRAQTLWDWWANDWRPEIQRIIDQRPGAPMSIPEARERLAIRWPLDRTIADMTKDVAGEQGRYGAACAQATPGEWAGQDDAPQALPGGEPWVDLSTTPVPGMATAVRCPSNTDRHLHAADRELYRRLAGAALMWARCAQEAAYAVGLYRLNEYAWHQANPAEMGFAPLPPLPAVSIDIDPFEPESVSMPPAVPPRARERRATPWGKIALGAGALALAGAIGWRFIRR